MYVWKRNAGKFELEVPPTRSARCRGVVYRYLHLRPLMCSSVVISQYYWLSLRGNHSIPRLKALAFACNIPLRFACDCAAGSLAYVTSLALVHVGNGWSRRASETKLQPHSKLSDQGSTTSPHATVILTVSIPSTASLNKIHQRDQQWSPNASFASPSRNGSTAPTRAQQASTSQADS